MANFFNYDQVVREDDGSVYLRDSKLYATRISQLDEFQDLIRKLYWMMHNSDYPNTKEYVDAVVFNGPDGLKRIVVRDSTAFLDPAAPAYVRKQHEQFSLEHIPSDLMEKCETLYRKLQRVRDGLPITIDDLSFDLGSGHTIKDLDAVKERIKLGCRLPVQAETQQEADDMEAAIIELRRLRDRGVDVFMLINAYMGDPDQFSFSGWPTIDKEGLLLSVAVHRKPSHEQIMENVRFAIGNSPTAGANGVAVTEIEHPVEPEPKRRDDEEED